MTANKLPIGIQDFEKLITSDFIYVDKTQHLYNIIMADAPCFLSRPRRFGKSITLSTLEAIFRNKRELFKGLWIDKSEWDWQKYPVIRLDMSRVDKDTPEELKLSLCLLLQQVATSYNVEIPKDLSPSFTLDALIKALRQFGKVVVLVDEYDKPIIDKLHDMTLARQNRDVLKQFYTILKAEDANLKFIFLTGVTKFSKVSVFSGLNNLDDLTMSDAYSALTGYTDDELKQYFETEVDALAKHLQIDKTDCYNKIKEWYDGYKFSENGQYVYNPFSVLRLLKHQAFKAHWFQTGTPSFLLKLLAEHQFDPQHLESIEVSANSFESFDINDIPTLPLLYQTGYLTIKHYDPKLESYLLHYPNREVSQAFTESLITYFATEKTNSSKYLIQLYRNLMGDIWPVEDFIKIINSILALMPYDLYINQEKHYHSLFFLIMKLAGIKLNAEFKTQLGRADACLVMNNKVIIFELKLNKTAQEGMKQIHKRKYYEIFTDHESPIHLVAINFNGKTRSIDDFIFEQLTESS